MMQRTAIETSRSAFRITTIAAACSALLLAGAAQPRQAPDEKEALAQQVVVTGMRGSIESVIALKRAASSIVEAISADDIGKLPDVSIAESISCMPGLTGQRAFSEILAEKQIDFQTGYTFEEGELKGMSLRLQVNNLSNAPYQTRPGRATRSPADRMRPSATRHTDVRSCSA